MNSLKFKSKTKSQHNRRSVVQLVNQSVNLSVSQSVYQSVSEPINQSVGQSVSLSVSQSVSHSVNQSSHRNPTGSHGQISVDKPNVRLGQSSRFLYGETAPTVPYLKEQIFSVVIYIRV
jgi:hypothetical protein